MSYSVVYSEGSSSAQEGLNLNTFWYLDWIFIDSFYKKKKKKKSSLVWQSAGGALHQQQSHVFLMKKCLKLNEQIVLVKATW